MESPLAPCHATTAALFRVGTVGTSRARSCVFAKQLRQRPPSVPWWAGAWQRWWLQRHEQQRLHSLPCRTVLKCNWSLRSEQRCVTTWEIKTSKRALLLCTWLADAPCINSHHSHDVYCGKVEASRWHIRHVKISMFVYWARPASIITQAMVVGWGAAETTNAGVLILQPQRRRQAIT